MPSTANYDLRRRKIVTRACVSIPVANFSALLFFKLIVGAGSTKSLFTTWGPGVLLADALMAFGVYHRVRRINLEEASEKSRSGLKI